jgi:hypothetical protein
VRIAFDGNSLYIGVTCCDSEPVRPRNDLYVVYTHNWVEDWLVDRFCQPGQTSCL